MKDKQNRLKTWQGNATWLVVLILCMTGLATYQFVQTRLDDFHIAQNQLAERAILSTKMELESYIDNSRHLTSLFSQAREAHLRQLVVTPNSFFLTNATFVALKSYFSEAGNFTIADEKGVPLMPDYKLKVGKGCKVDLLNYVKGVEKNSIFVHSNPDPSGYHIDILSNFDGGKVFFVSLDTTALVEILKRFKLVGHQLILMRDDKKNLVDLTINGPLPNLLRNESLSEREQQSVIARVKIAGTRWELLDIAEHDLFTAKSRELISQALIGWLIFAAVSLLLLRRVRKEEMLRQKAEEKLQYSHDNLVERVESRTVELRASRDELYRRATYDDLTGLMNRVEFDRCLKELILKVSCEGGESILGYLDLDQFKLINDSCGHQAGDAALRKVANILLKHLRRGDSIARLGGDEFGLLMSACSPEKAQKTMESLIKHLSEETFKWQEKSFLLNFSIGLTVIDVDAEDSTELMRQADLACYVAKDLGRARVHLYSGGDKQAGRRNEELGMLADVPGMISENRLSLYAQPIVCSRGLNQKFNHYEILLRLKGKDGRFESPAKFIPVAERYNLLGQIDLWVIKNAFKAIRNVDDDFHISINLSANSLSDKALLSYIDAQCLECFISPERVTFEITETATIADLSEAIDLIKGLRERGYLFALDDFGTGVSSFGYMKELPFDQVKIDGSYVRNIVEDEVSRALVQAMIKAAHALNKKVVAEFVENQQIVDLLLEMDVDYLQGYHLGKPQDLQQVLRDF